MSSRSPDSGLIFEEIIPFYVLQKKKGHFFFYYFKEATIFRFKCPPLHCNNHSKNKSSSLQFLALLG